VRPKKAENAPISRCDDCVYFDYDEAYDENVCTLSLDEDEMVAFLTGKTQSCPYYKRYDEYMTVRKQN